MSDPTPPAVSDAMREAVARVLWGPYDTGRQLDAICATLASEIARLTGERDAAREERDALLGAANFRPGSFRSELSRKVILEDIAGMRPEMVAARRRADRVRDDADLWTMRMLDEWPGDTLLTRVWRQRNAAKARAEAAEAETARLRAALVEAERTLSGIAKDVGACGWLNEDDFSPLPEIRTALTSQEKTDV